MQELAARKRAGMKLTKAQKQRLEEGRAERKRQDQVVAQGKDIAINYYGDTHLVLDAKAVAGRVVYTATDHRPALTSTRSSPSPISCCPPTRKRLTAARPYRSDVTRLKEGAVHKPGPKGAVHMDVINAILDPKNAPLVKRGLPFEIQIFGGIDLRKDVTEIDVSPGAPAGVYENVQAWAKANAPHITVQQIAVPASARIPVDPTTLKGPASPEEKARAAAANEHRRSSPLAADSVRAEAPRAPCGADSPSPGSAVTLSTGILGRVDRRGEAHVRAPVLVRVERAGGDAVRPSRACRPGPTNQSS